MAGFDWSIHDALMSAGFAGFIVSKSVSPYNLHIIVDFRNGYAASVMGGTSALGGDKGLYELVPLSFHNGNYAVPKWVVPLGEQGDIHGFLTADEVIDYCRRLQSHGKCTITPEQFYEDVFSE